MDRVQSTYTKKSKFQHKPQPSTAEDPMPSLETLMMTNKIMAYSNNRKVKEKRYSMDRANFQQDSNRNRHSFSPPSEDRYSTVKK